MPGSRSLALILVLIVMTSTIQLDISSSESLGVLLPGQEIYHKQFYSGMSGIDWSGDGQYIAVLLTSSKLAILTSTGQLVRSYGLPHGTGQVVWRPGYDHVAVDAGSKVLVYSISGSIVYQADLGSRTLSVAWSFDGDRLAAGTDNGTLFMADLKAGYGYKYRLPGASITSLAFPHDKSRIIIGDSNGYVKIFSFETLRVINSVRLGSEVVRSIAVNPVDNSIAVMTDTHTYIGYYNGTHIVLEHQLSYGGIGNLEWSPDGNVLFIPAENRGVIVAKNGTVLRYLAPPEDYPVIYAAWNPAMYSRLAIAGFNSIYGTGALIVVYSGALVTVTSSTPVSNVCWGTLCDYNITFSPDQQNITVKLYVDAHDITGKKVEAIVDLNLYLTPFQELTIDAGKILASGKGNYKVENDMTLLIVLHAPEAHFTVETSNGRVEVPGMALLAPPGLYKAMVSLEQPKDYLGPQWILTKNLTLLLSKGEVILVNYTWYTLKAVTGKLQVLSDPGATVFVVFPNTTVSKVIPTGSGNFTIPTGKYSIIIKLPEDNSLIPNSDILKSENPVAVYPGDNVKVSFHYNDVVGNLTIRAPQGSMVKIIPPWSTSLNPIEYNITMNTNSLTYRAYPGTYKVKITLPSIPNFIGPNPPTGEINVTVEKGYTSVVDAYSISKIADYLKLLDSSSHVTILANKGYTVILHANNQTYEYNITRNLTLILPPGQYKIDLVKPGKTLVIVKSKKFQVTGPGNMTINLLVSKKKTTWKPPVTQATSGGGGGKKKLIVGVIIILLIIIIAVLLIMRIKKKSEEIIL